jgi:hypothetical protein
MRRGDDQEKRVDTPRKHPPKTHGERKIHDDRASEPATDDPGLILKEATPGSGMFGKEDDGGGAPSG